MARSTQQEESILNQLLPMSKSATTSIRKHEKFDKNPFVKGLYAMKRGRKTIAVGQKTYGLFDRKTGEIEDPKQAHTFVGVQRIVDKDEFVKIFISGITNIVDLSQLAQQVLSYFFTASKIGDDKVYFNMVECCEFTNKSTVSCSRGLTELLEKDFIARSSQMNIYFINVNYFFKGDRYTLFNDVILKGTEMAERVEKQTKEAEEQRRQLDLFGGNDA